MERDNLGVDHKNSCELKVFEVAGTPYEIGFQIGTWDRDRIRRVLAHHVDAADWPGGSLVDVPSLKIDHKNYWGSDGWMELQGMADGAGVPIENLLYHNLQKYALGACSHFALNAGASGRFYHGANIDVPSSLLLKDSLAFHIQKRCPKGGISYTIPGMSGVLLGIDGFNEKGLFLSSSMLLDAPRTKRLTGTNHGVIVSRLLQSCADLDEAVRFLSAVSGWGGWAIAVSCPKEKQVVYAEYHGNQIQIDRSGNRFICCNHSRLFPVDKVPEHSRRRLERLQNLLNFDARDGEEECQPEKILFDRYNPNKGTVSRFRTMNTLFRVDHAVSLLADDTGNCAFALSQDAEQGIFTSTIRF